MRLQVNGLTWYLWRRNRLGASLILLCWLVLAAMAHTIPSSELSQNIIFAFSLMLLLVLLSFAVFAHLAADVASVKSGYPAHLWTLPLRTWQLVAWPMLLGTAAVALFWMATAQFIFRQYEISMAIWWPAAMFAAFLACLQVLFWSSLPMPYLRIILYITLAPTVTAAGVLLERLEVPEWKIVAAFVSVIPFAFLAAFAGLSRARQGNQEPWRLPLTRFLSKAWVSQPQKPFASVADAQFWFEWRRSGFMLGLCVLAALLLISTPLLLIKDLTPLTFNLPHGKVGSVEVNAWLKVSYRSLCLPFLFALAFSCGFLGSGRRQEDSLINSFLATRPITPGQLALAKIKTTALSSLAAWSIQLFVLAIWLVLPGRDGDITGPLGLLLWKYHSPAALLELSVGLVLFILWTWSLQVQGSFISSMGKPAVSMAVAGLYLLVLVFGFLFVRHPGWDRVLTVVISIAAGIKLCSMAVISMTLVRRGLVKLRSLAAVVAVWFSLAVFLFVYFSQILPRFRMTCVAAVVVVLLPFVRLSVMPLILERSRHN